MPEQMKSIEEEIDAWVHDLLASDEARSEAPAELYAQVRRTARNRERWFACGIALSVAAAMLAAVLLWPRDNRLNNHRQVVTTMDRASQATREELMEDLPPVNPVATFVGQSDFIVVPIGSNDPTVTIVQVYPTSLAKKRWRRKAAFLSILSQTQLKPTNPVRGG